MTNEAPTLTREQVEHYFRLGSIFMPYASARQRSRYPNLDGNARFVHYTSAEAAFEIIRSKRIWMRNAMCMSDYQEVNHGYGMLLGAKQSLQDFKSALEECLPGVLQEAAGAFDTRWPEIRVNTYVTSVSEHDPEEDLLGRLSMWRAFGAGVPCVALVLEVPWLSSATQSLGLIFSPVAYMNQDEVSGQIQQITANVRERCEFLRGCNRGDVVGVVFTMFLTGVTCLKHSGFHEEREWRAIHGPHPLTSPLLMRPVVKCINGVPQNIYEIPLDVTAAPMLADLEFSRIFHRLIIGPTQFPVPMARAFTDALIAAGVTDAPNRVCASTIPIRT